LRYALPWQPPRQFRSFFNRGYPVTAGLVASLNRPGGNVTGVTTLGVEVGQKRLELIHEVVPKATIIALLVNPANRLDIQSKDIQDAALILGLQLRILEASAERDFDAVFANLAEMRAGALVIGGDAFLIASDAEISSRAWAGRRRGRRWRGRSRR
jgi:putative tryptophan/tyrosine transport system substrate-binding protein